ncbi:MAG: imidazolonepropionase [Myxococcaceae bacterium]|nr:imidazolonepropionase [Myxococcaceae bacterium]
MFDILIRNSAWVLTGRGDVRGDAMAALAPVRAGAVGIKGASVAWVGLEADLPKEALAQTPRVLDAQGGLVTPGLLDCHTHAVFAGQRAHEFAMRCAGKSYLEIAAAGGGIASTVRATRKATEDDLIASARPRLRRLLEQGVTTVEVKSGYGLNFDDELKMLRVVKRLNALQPATLVPTLLCAHAIPEEHRAHREAYFELCLNSILPAAAKEHLAAFCDIFVEQHAFTADEARTLLARASQLGMGVRLHVDQLTPGQKGAELAVELKASSADHLEQISEQGIAALARSETVAVLAPTSTLFVKARPFAPGRKLREAGAVVALCTNVNPGSAMSDSVSLAMGLACLENGLTPAEALLGFTRAAAMALRLPQAGRLQEGAPADVAIFACPDIESIPYNMGTNLVRTVVKSGRVVVG